MNVFGKRARSWRKARKRGVSPIIATILLVAITVVLAAVLYVLISGLTKGPGSAPLTGNYTNMHAGATNNVWSLDIGSFPSATWSDINFKLTNTAGATQAASYAVTSLYGSVATSSAGTSWQTGGSVTLNSTQTLTVTGPSGSNLLGWTLTTIGVNGYSGSFTTVIQTTAA